MGAKKGKGYTMINPFKALGDLNTMRKSAMAIQQALEGEELDIREGNVHIVISGSQKVKLVEIDGVPSEPVKRAVNNAIQRSQQVAAQKLAEVSKQMNLQ